MKAMERRTDTETIQEERTDARLDEGGHDRFSHYVDKDKLTEALINGTPVIALCGKVWVPSRDPGALPRLPQRKWLYDLGPEAAAGSGRSVPERTASAEIEGRQRLVEKASPRAGDRWQGPPP